jgi:hypothetical protein
MFFEARNHKDEEIDCRSLLLAKIWESKWKCRTWAMILQEEKLALLYDLQMLLGFTLFCEPILSPVNSRHC